MKKVTDKVIIITGASAGIGLATAKLLAAQGAKVALAARSVEVLHALSEELPDSFPVAVDMSDETSIKEMIHKVKQHFGRIDILVNNAGQGLYAEVEHIGIHDYRRILDVNVIGPLVAMQQVIPIMREQGSGHILNISSLVSKNYFPFMAAYASTKYALNCLSLTARAELEKDNIIVNVMHPGLTDTGFGQNALKAEGAEERAAQSRESWPEADSVEHVAERILHAIESERAEVMAHE